MTATCEVRQDDDALFPLLHSGTGGADVTVPTGGRFMGFGETRQILTETAEEHIFREHVQVDDDERLSERQR